MSTLEAAFHHLPEPILDKLQSMIRRVRRLLFLRGFFATLAVALACLLTIMAIDATITLFSFTARWILSLAGLLVTLLAAWWFLFRPLSRRFTLTHMARILEIRHPELQERISTAVELLSSNDPESIKGSEELIRAVVESAVADVGTVDPNTEFKPAKTRKFIAVGGACLAIVVLILAIWPKQSWTLLARAVAPFLNIGNAYADSLVIDPGDVRVARGDSVTIEVSVKHKRLKRAEIRRMLEGGEESVERMTLIAEAEDGTKRFSLTFPSVQESFDYRVRAGAALSEYFDVDAVDPPAVEKLTIRYDFPDYTGLPNFESDTETGEIRAVAHTRVRVAATLNKPAWNSKLVLNDAVEAEDVTVQRNVASWEFELLPSMNGSWRIELEDEEGFANDPVTWPVAVLPDKAPIVRIVDPILRELRLKPTEQLAIGSEVVEDFGFGDTALLVTPVGASVPQVLTQPLPLPTGQASQFHSAANLNLAEVKLAEGQSRIAVQVQVRDNRPSDYDGPGVGLSEVIFIEIDRNAKSLADQAIEAQRRDVDQQLKETKRELEQARDEMRRAEQELNKSEEVNERARERLDEFTEHTEAAREKLDQLASKLDNTLFDEQSQQARELADQQLSEAMERADMIPVTDEKKDRVAEAKESRQAVEEALKGLDQLSREMREAEDDYRAISKLNELANRQQELAAKADDWAERARQEAEQMQQDEQVKKQFDQQQERELSQFQSEQNQVEQQLGQMLKDNQAALAEVLEQQREQAGGLSERAEALAREQESLRNINEQAIEAKENRQDVLREQLLDHLREQQEQLAAEAKAGAEAAGQEAESMAQAAAATPKDSEAPAGSDSPSEPQAGEAQGDAPEADSPKAPGESPADPAESKRALAESLSRSAERAEEVARRLGDRKLDEAQEAAKEAGESLAEAAQHDAPAAPTPAMKETPAAAENGANPETPSSEVADSNQPSAERTPASDLAARQEAISEQIESLRAGNVQAVLSAMESALEAQAESLQAEARGFEQTLNNLQQNNARSQADRAEQSLTRGGQQADEASRRLSEAQDQQSRAMEREQVAEGELADDARSNMQRGEQSQEQSRNSFQEAAQALAGASEQIGQSMEGLEPSDMDERITNSEDLAQGFEDVAESSRSQDSQQAAAQSRQAADSLRQLAQTAVQRLTNSNNPNQPDGENQPPSPDLTGEPNALDPNETGQKTADINGEGIPPELEEMGISAADWARFKGALVGGNATAIETELPAEYRELVGRYFQVIAKEAAAE